MSPNLTYRYEVLRLFDLDPAPMLAAGDVGDAILGLLCRGGANAEVVRRIVDRTMPLDAAARGRALTHLSVLAGLRKADGMVRKELERMDVDVSDNAVIRPLIDKAQAAGRTEGRTEGIALLVAKRLRRRFGELPHGLDEALSGSRLEDLLAVEDRIDDAADIDDALGPDVSLPASPGRR